MLLPFPTFLFVYVCVSVSSFLSLFIYLSIYLFLDMFQSIVPFVTVSTPPFLALLFRCQIGNVSLIPFLTFLPKLIHTRGTSCLLHFFMVASHWFGLVYLHVLKYVWGRDASSFSSSLSSLSFSSYSSSSFLHCVSLLRVPSSCLCHKGTDFLLLEPLQ